MKGTILAFLSMMCFNVYPIISKYLLEKIGPEYLIFLRQVLFAIILLIILKLSGRMSEIKKLSRNELIVIAMVGVFIAFLSPLLFLMGLNLTSVTNSILVGKAEFLITPLLAIFFLKDKITPKQIFGAVIAFYGIYIIATQKFQVGLSWQSGDFLILLGCVVCSFAVIIYKKYLKYVKVLVFITLVSVSGAILTSILSFFFLDFSVLFAAMDLEFILLLIVLVLISTVAGNLLWFKALETTSVTTVSIVGLSSPVIGVALTLLIMQEKIFDYQVLGGILIILGMVLVEMHIRKHRSFRKQKIRMKLIHARF